MKHKKTLSVPEAWAVLAITFGFCVLFFGWMAYDSFRLSVPGAALVGLCFFCVILGLVFPGAIRTAVLNQLPNDAALIAAREEEFPALDKAALQRWTDEFQALGFEIVFDYRLHSPSKTLVAGFGRLMRHERHGCLLEINQLFPAGTKAMPLCCSLMSVFGTDEEIPRPAFAPELPPIPLPQSPAPRLETLPWSLSTMTRLPRTIDAMCGLPRAVGDRSLRNMTAQAMLERHLKHRAELAAQLALPVFFGMDAERFQAWCALQRALMRHKVQRTNFYVGLPRAYFMPKRRPFDAALAVAYHRMLGAKFPQ